MSNSLFTQLSLQRMTAHLLLGLKDYQFVLFLIKDSRDLTTGPQIPKLQLLYSPGTVGTQKRSTYVFCGPGLDPLGVFTNRKPEYFQFSSSRPLKRQTQLLVAAQEPLYDSGFLFSLLCIKYFTFTFPFISAHTCAFTSSPFYLHPLSLCLDVCVSVCTLGI